MSNKAGGSGSNGCGGLLGVVSVMLCFGLLTLLVVRSIGGFGMVEKRAVQGVFNKETIALRQSNLEAEIAEQSKLINYGKVEGEFAAITAAAGKVKAAKSAVVILGSPTSLKQMQEAAAAEAKAQEAPQAPATTAPEPKKEEVKPAPAPVEKKVEKPAAPKEATEKKKVSNPSKSAAKKAAKGKPGKPAPAKEVKPKQESKPQQ